ncbi:VanZ family protein [Ornithinibacillus halotolerans]|uniref:VanZ-like domain-containing protein n=1 Tax=Ornithinibacillus halotolerans TaxID=1274357 RepID=A0A916RQ55_9BACI|nr:VanZ family protein [Ornithinibacillus halotolerans]GGA65182.1 hypothetical protein GCM10008025_06290 [Ornithinibacillus halotolerans]
MYKVVSVLVVTLWMMLIFHFSSQPAIVSSELSAGITSTIVENLDESIPNIGSVITDHIIRKNAHFFIYLILGILTINLFNCIGLHKVKALVFSIIFCVLYAISDEIHQLFVPGRGAQIKDIVIDSAGAIVGICFYLVVGRIIRKKNSI